MIVIIMGVTGVGKTTVGQLLGAKTGWTLYDADAYHSPENVEKMRAGIPLTDDDRWPWLDRLNALLREAESRGESAILACSALKQRYRERLQQGLHDVRLRRGRPNDDRTRWCCNRSALSDVLNDCVTDTKLTAYSSNNSTNFAKSVSDHVSRSTL